jgi:Ca2+-binding EF-hand superfamily protein
MSLIAGLIESQHEVKALDKMFKFFDKDNTGILTLDKIKEGTDEIIGKSRSEMYNCEELWESLDIKGDGKVNYEIFRIATLNRAKLLC